MATAISPSASSANIRKPEKIFILKDGINVFPNLNSGKVRKFQGFGNLCILRSLKSGNPYFSFSKTNSPSRTEKEVSVESINADSTGQNAFQVKTGLIDHEVPNFKP
jgi:hypothetical protein